MDPVFEHRPVMVDEVVELLAGAGPGLLVDATVGGGGHAAALLEANTQLRLLGLDRDPRAVAAASRRLSRFGSRATVRHATFDEMTALVAGATDRTAPVVGVLFDLGVSSPQLDDAARGFSFRHDGPLDMRMDPDEGPTAADVVNGMSADELAALFAANGEGRFARRIARAVVTARPLESTGQLAAVVRAAIPAPARTRGHPARRVFQALRIEVNDELELLAGALPASLDLLGPGGRCVAIAYHSGEDRLVKSAFTDASTGGCICPPGLPCVCGAVPTVRFVFRGAHRPSPVEVEHNPRAEAARLRAVERLRGTPPDTATPRSTP
jgi:16S rRNA (cytosine1402-N4)-methyltransferase